MKTLFSKIIILIILTLIIKELVTYLYSNPFYIKEILIFSPIFLIIYFIYKKSCIENLNTQTKIEDYDMVDDEEHYELQKDKIAPILQIIDSHKSDKFFSIALTAPWGAGKSSTLKAIERESQNKYYPVYLNTWQLENSANLLNEIKKEIDNILFKENKLLWFKNLIESILFSNYFRLTSKYISKSDFSITLPFEQTIKNSKDRFNNLLKNTLKDKKILLLIDEVDRLHDSKEIVDVFKIIRYTASFDNIIVLTALDLEQIEKILSLDIDYIHKIFSVKYQLPNIDSNDLMKYFKEIIFPKMKDYIEIKEFEKLLLSKNYTNSIFENLPTFRVVKSSFNETYNFLKHLKTSYGDDWRDFISFEFVYVINIIKSTNFKDFNYLIIQNNLLGVLQQIKLVDEKPLEFISQGTRNLLLCIINKNSALHELYLEIYKNYKIYDYNISNKKFLNILEDETIIDNSLYELQLIEYRTNFLKNLISYIYTDEENQRKLLKKTIDIVIKNKATLDYKSLIDAIVIRRFNLSTLVTEDNIEVLLKLKEDDEIFSEFIYSIFENFNSDFKGKFIEEKAIEDLLERYFEYLILSEKDTLDILNKLFIEGYFIQNVGLSNKNLADNIRKLIYDKFYEKAKDDISIFLIRISYFEELNEFIENYNIKIDSLINDKLEYQLIKKEDGYMYYYLGEKLKEELNKEWRGNLNTDTF